MDLEDGLNCSRAASTWCTALPRFHIERAARPRPARRSVRAKEMAESGALLASEPEPEPQIQEEGEPIGPLDAEVVAIVSGDGEAGEMRSFRQLAEMLRASDLKGDHKICVPPVDLADAVEVSSLVDMEEVAGMDAEDVEELASSLLDQLVPEEASDEGPEQENVLVLGEDDEIDKACVAACPPLDLTKGCFRCPLELPAELIPQAERQLGETAEVRTAAITELRGKAEALESTGIGKGKKNKPIAFPRKDDQFLCTFLRCKKFRVDDALKVMTKYTQFVHEFADVLGSLDSEGEPMMDPKNQQLLGMYVIPGCTKRGGRLITFRLAEIPVELLERIDPKVHAEIMYKQSIRFMMSLFTRLVSDPWATVCGVSMCEDWGDAPPFKLMMRLDNCLSSKQKKIVFGLFSDVLPMRLSGFYVLNQPKWFSVRLLLRRHHSAPPSVLSAPFSADLTAAAVVG